MCFRAVPAGLHRLALKFTPRGRKANSSTPKVIGGVSGIEDRVYISVYRDWESEAFICENLGVDGECRLLHDFAFQGGQRARGWEADGAVSCEISVKGKVERGGI